MAHGSKLLAGSPQPKANSSRSHFTVSVVEPLTPAELAVMVVVPVARACANPGVVPTGGDTLLFGPITATSVLLEVQVTKFVISRVVLSENVPVAVNCCVALTPSDGLAGVTAMELKVTVVATGLTTRKSGVQPAATEGQRLITWID